ncbi:SNF2 family N-terminal domain-containing protein [Lineolata rhizophorae]|uniref:DNA helicase n=1 Tax=Lineolata rhizophorae TaxID=578093 RepID=A0A6A6P7Z6_9PEZI|nr:SNF2 family N-terminal domain-containing protein [Lineolata rhizophorae]
MTRSSSSLADADRVSDTPTKRRKTDTGLVGALTSANRPYNSEDDSGDELFDHETIATLPLGRPSKGPSMVPGRNAFVTQPTQVLSNPPSRNKGGELIQVAATSPLCDVSPASSPPAVARASQHTSQRPSVSNRAPLQSLMAPPGTVYCPPAPRQATPADDDLSEPDPIVEVSSDDEPAKSRADIPQTFMTNGGRSHGKASTTADSRESRAQFSKLASAFAYDPNKPSRPNSQTIDDCVSSYANSRKRLASGGEQKAATTRNQSKPSKATPVSYDIGIDDIMDYKVQTLVKRMMGIFPNKSVGVLQNALALNRNNYNDAIFYLTEMDEKEADDDQAPIDLTGDEPDELALSSTPFKVPASKPSATLSAKPAAKRQLQNNARSLHDKYSATQLKKAEDATPAITPPKPRRRLVKGRKNPSSPIEPSPQKDIPSRPKHSVFEIDADSGASGLSEIEGGGSLEAKVLKFLNECSAENLADTASQKDDVVRAVIAKRPFKKLDDVRKISLDSAVPGKRSKKRPVGDRVVDICLDMFTGYTAVDTLVSQCENIAKPISASMKAWGVNVSGSSKSGELDILSLNESKLRDSGVGSPSSSPDEDGGVVELHRKKSKFLQKPAIMSRDLTLKDYQVVGLNWLNLLWSNKMSCILADDMGLGKTCQVIAFLSHLYETGVKGPHLIVVPVSTLENWLREFQNFSPVLTVEPYYGSESERINQQDDILAQLDNIDVIITNYDTAVKRGDNKFLRSIKPVVCVFDEGHALKNSTSNRYQQLIRIPAQFRLLLTGTPLQNNLQELVSLLAFMMPKLFAEKSEDLTYIFKHKAKTTDQDHSALLSTQRIERARSIVSPFILRRKKYQVLKELPPKVRRVEHCTLTDSQKAIYESVLAEERAHLEKRAAGLSKASDRKNPLMRLRKAAIHPLLFRSRYDDEKLRKIAKACLTDDQWRESNPNCIFEELTQYSDFEIHELCFRNPQSIGRFALRDNEWMDCSKVHVLAQLLEKWRASGDRTLIFSQFTMVMDILEHVLSTLNLPFYRFDGATRAEDRQAMVDDFAEDKSIEVFLLSTKSGGAGINLASANKVVIFDSSFNPQDDIQAENRAHRVGQTKEVEIVRLVSKGTIEEQILKLGESKLALDARVAGDRGEVPDSPGQSAEAAENKGAETVQDMLLESLSRETGDLKEQYLEGLKAAGLDMSAAA